MENIRIGVLGCAKIAKKYAIKAFQRISNAQVIAIASRSEVKAREYGELFKIEHEASYDALLKREDIDAVYIPLPPGLHEEWIIKSAKARKHIICEKSLSNNYKSVKRIIKACKEFKVVLYENFMCEYHPQHEKVIELIKNGEIGQVRVMKLYFGFPMMDNDNFRYNKDLGGGSLNDAGAYTIFMARKIFGSEAKTVTSKLYIDNKYGVDLNGSAIIEFEENRVAFVSFGFDLVYQNNYSIWGSRGVINVDRAFSIPPEKKPTVELLKNDGTAELKLEIDINKANQFELIFQDFCNTIKNRELHKTKNKYDDMLNQARLMEAIRVSNSEARRVIVSQIK